MCINFDGMVTSRSVLLELSFASEPIIGNHRHLYVFIFVYLIHCVLLVSFGQFYFVDVMQLVIIE